MSTLSVDLIEPVGSTLTFGQSGDTMTIPSGAIFTNNGTANGFAAGSTHASQWRLTTSFSNSVNPIASNLQAVIAADPTTSTASPSASTALGAPMAVDAGGRFTFPVTGMWLVTFSATLDGDTYNALPQGGTIYHTVNNSTYTIVQIENAMSYLGYYFNSWGSVLFKIADVTQEKVSFAYVARSAGDQMKGNAAYNQTVMTFDRVGSI
jgi:hypothetical protein